MLPVKSGSYIIGKYVEGIDYVNDGRTYVVLTQKEGCTYKRVFKDDENKELKLKPDNESYTPYNVSYNDILELWEFTCCINTQEYQPDEINLGSVMNMLRGLKVDLKSD